MSQKKKNNIILGSLCAVVLLMVVGYAALQSVLNITGTSNVSSNWNILITNIETKNIVGGASNASEPTGKGTLTATFNTNLVSPGDSIEYDITVSNQGSLNAVLEKITVSDSNNPAIKFTTTGITEGNPLNAGGSAVLTVKVEYDNAVTSQPENTKSELTVTLDYVQEGTSTITPGGDTFTGTVYSRNVLTDANFSDETWKRENLIWPGDSIEKVNGYTEDYTLLNSSPFLKHTVKNNQLESTEVCFIQDGLHCLKANDYENSKTLLLSVLGESMCGNNHDTSIYCSDGYTLSASATGENGTIYSGSVYVTINSEECRIFPDGSAGCRSM